MRNRTCLLFSALDAASRRAPCVNDDAAVCLRAEVLESLGLRLAEALWVAIRWVRQCDDFELRGIHC